MVLGRSTMVLGRSTKMLGRSTRVLGRSTMVSHLGARDIKSPPTLLQGGKGLGGHGTPK